ARSAAAGVRTRLHALSAEYAASATAAGWTAGRRPYRTRGSGRRSPRSAPSGGGAGAATRPGPGRGDRDGGGGPAVTAAVLTADSTPAVVAAAEQFSATDQATGAHATVGAWTAPPGQSGQHGNSPVSRAR
ncbi:hypothetical protein A7X96_043005, partial [Streptomyces sp. ST1020]